MTDLDALLAMHDEWMRIPPQIPLPGVGYEWDGRLLRITGQMRGMLRGPRDIGVEGDDLDRLIQRQVDYFGARGEAFEWKVRGHDLPADLPDRLLAAGFVPELQSAVLIGFSEQIAAEPVLPDGVQLRRVTAEADMRRIAEMQSAVWGGDLSWIGDYLWGLVVTTPDDIVVLVAEAAGEVVCAAFILCGGEGSYGALLGGSTLPAWQRRGIYRALVHARAQIAVERGLELLQVDASPHSAPILQKMGFHQVSTSALYAWTPPDAQGSSNSQSSNGGSGS